MPAYQLRCVCSAVNLVSVGQAGGTLACQACGKILDIPKLRNFHLMEMEEATVRSPVNAGWGFPQGFMLFGIVIAVASFTLAGVLAVPAGSEINSELIRSNVDAAPIAEVYKAWIFFASSGVLRPSTIDEELAIRRTVLGGSGAQLLRLIGVIGMIVAAIGLGLSLKPSRRSSHNATTKRALV
ncbi:MAG: hypothetical protein DWH80_11675 [Planctomycetota bacterium]|nr:MAG: hypothetical protein DWH80_11675 [Planctomycetota bacterium]